jgi:hypothetical protein
VISWEKSEMPEPAPIAQSDEVARLVRDRIRYIGMLYDLMPTIAGIERVEEIGENGWTHPWKWFDASMNYLALTCFDMLGQAKSFVAFDQWLEQKDLMHERENAIAAVAKLTDPIEITKRLHEIYKTTHGVKNSFYRFVQDELTDEERKRLFDSVTINKVDVAKNMNVGTIDDEKKKLAFLFETRNKYTHFSVNTGSEAGGIFQEVYHWMILEGKRLKGAQTVRIDIKPSGRMDYLVRNWPFVLVESVEAVLQRRYEGRRISRPATTEAKS